MRTLSRKWRNIGPLLVLLTLKLGLSFSLTGFATAQQADVQSVIGRARGFVENNPGWSLHGRDQSYDVKDVIVDQNGSQHVRFNRRYKNLEVLGGDFVVHSDRLGNFLNASLTLKRQIDLSLKPSLSPSAAINTALKVQKGDTQNIPPKLFIYARGDIPTLAWDVLVFDTKNDGTPIEKHVIIDANLGTLLDSWDDIKTISKTSKGNGVMTGITDLTTDYDVKAGTYYLRDPSRGNMFTINMSNRTAVGKMFTSSKNDMWGDGTLANTVSVGADAHYGAAETWDYFQTLFGRNGIANDGVGASSRVHYGQRYNNAFWSDSCFCMTYGDGDGQTFLPFVTLDVAGHEMSHGVTSRTANLTYSGESGGLNEATSDIFGTMVEFAANISNDPGDYLVGEKLYKTQSTTSSKPNALRYMYQPSLDGSSADCWYTGLKNLDVHFSSGVANHFFYLLAEGSTNPVSSKTCQAGDTKSATGNANINGIGKDKAAQIWSTSRRRPPSGPSR
ncbi:MAG: M4 family metallopeptidase [Hyphomicrobium sp.]